MTERLPSGAQFLDASFHLMAARDEARMAFVLTGTSINANSCAKTCIEKMKEAAAALGYEMIERTGPSFSRGGRMDMGAGDA